MSKRVKMHKQEEELITIISKMSPSSKKVPFIFKKNILETLEEISERDRGYSRQLVTQRIDSDRIVDIYEEKIEEYVKNELQEIELEEIKEFKILVYSLSLMLDLADLNEIKSISPICFVLIYNDKIKKEYRSLIAKYCPFGTFKQSEFKNFKWKDENQIIDMEYIKDSFKNKENIDFLIHLRNGERKYGNYILRLVMEEKTNTQSQNYDNEFVAAIEANNLVFTEEEINKKLYEILTYANSREPLSTVSSLLYLIHQILSNQPDREDLKEVFFNHIFVTFQTFVEKQFSILYKKKSDIYNEKLEEIREYITSNGLKEELQDYYIKKFDLKGTYPIVFWFINLFFGEETKEMEEKVLKYLEEALEERKVKENNRKRTFEIDISKIEDENLKRMYLIELKRQEEEDLKSRFN